MDLASFSWLESQRRARRDVEAAPIGGGAIETQEPVHLEEVGVRSNLNRPVADVVHAQTDPSRP